jgi:hypothetical protein
MAQFAVSSSAFADGGDIPDLYTCRGRNISPPLSFEAPPAETRAYALIMEDLDTPFGVLTHWVVYNITSDVHALTEAVPPGKLLANNARQGRNSMFRLGYMGPCPPWGRHRYTFRAFALDRTVESDAVLNKKKLLRLIQPHILAEATLLGYYSRNRGQGDHIPR